MKKITSFLLLVFLLALIPAGVAQAEVDIVLNQESLDVIAKRRVGDDQVQCIGLDISVSYPNESRGINGNGLVLTQSQADCNYTNVTPGVISLTATKDAPENPVVVSQDPDDTGVDLTWIVRITPTIFDYEEWGKIPYPNEGCKGENAECKINMSGKPCCQQFMCVSNDDGSGNGKCEVNPDVPQYGCISKTKNFREDLVTVNPAAVLIIPSRNWILGELAVAYPGAYLKHPIWGFSATQHCQEWEGNTCVWRHTEGSVQVEDPGWYDLIVTGTTSGTPVTDPRTFSLVGGQFGVYLIDSSMRGLQ